MNFRKELLLYKFNINLSVLGVRRKSYSHTVILPKTDLPLRLENKKLLERDAYMNELLKRNDAYKWQKNHLSEPEFILHDGPPYANGSPHMGHAINKILKDVILRQKILEGRKIDYVPGWDCHGLPIELKANKNQNSLNDPLALRSKARYFAEKAVENQKKAFESWGIIGDWSNIYTTYSKDYIKNQLKQFYKLYTDNLIFRDTKPIHWSPSTRTALAEAELEYKENHKSLDIYVQFKIDKFPKLGLPLDKPVYALVWTTTPWTLPSNQGICYNPKLTYCLCTRDSGNTLFIVAAECLEELKNTLGCELELLQILPEGVFSGAEYRHPIYKNKLLPFFPASHVTDDKGTGLVHTAPAHGPEDFVVALENALTIKDLVDEEGRYRSDAGIDLEGKFVLKEGNQTVVQKLGEDLIHISEITHSYPYDWRTKKPVIIRASKQWFLDTNAVKTRAMDIVSKLSFLPNTRGKIFREEFTKQINKRSFWCISRQRLWGIPIPVFFLKNDEVLFNRDIIEHQCKLLEEEGPDYWWTLPMERLLPENLQRNIDVSEIKRSEDILDIWFDSGISWSKIVGEEKIADLYLEGNDQFNGWFYSSLITSLASRNIPPFKSIYVHGFAVDKNGLKMSKSLGNVVDPLEIVNGKKGQKPYGVDVLRWWVSCHAANTPQVYVSDNVLEVCSKEVQKIRSVLRFTLAALNGYETTEDPEYSSLFFLDKYILYLLHDFNQQSRTYADNYAFNKIGKLVINFLTNEISGLYYSSIKDRLYCETQDSSTRKAAQYVLKQILNVVSLSIAPMLPHLVEELHINIPTAKTGDSFFTTRHKGIDDCWKNEDVKELMDIVLDMKKNFNLQLGSASTTMELNIKLSERIFEKFQKMNTLKQWNYELSNILMCANVDISNKEGQTEDYLLEVAESSKFICPRCRRMQSDEKDDLCVRCIEVVEMLKNKEYSVM